MAKDMFEELNILDLDDLLSAEDVEDTEDSEDTEDKQNTDMDGSDSDEKSAQEGPSDEEEAECEKDSNREEESADADESDSEDESADEESDSEDESSDQVASGDGDDSAEIDELIIEEVPLDAPPRKVPPKTSVDAQTEGSRKKRAPGAQRPNKPKISKDAPTSAQRSAAAPTQGDARRQNTAAPSRQSGAQRPAKGKSPAPQNAGAHSSRKAPMPDSRPVNPKASQRVDQDDGEKQPFPLHLALLAAIVVVIVVAAVRFFVWSQGKELTVHSGQNSNKYIIEVNDNMVYLSDSKLEGHTDDGVTTVLCLGNEPFSQDTSSSGLAGQIAALGNCNVINAAFPDSQVTCENAEYSVDSLDSMDDIFNLFYVSYAISIGDFSSLETVASAHTDDPTYQQSVDALKNTDFGSVDIIAIMYDGIDYINGMAMQNPDVPEELTTYVGSLTSSFQLLQAAYPYIRIVFMSPYYSEYDGASGRTTDIGNGTLVNYFQWAYDTCGSSSVSFLDNYYGSVNENNYTDYLSDSIHLNSAGCTKVADHFVYKVIQDNYAEYDVSSMAVASGGN